MRSVYSFNGGWHFHPCASDSHIATFAPGEAVVLPHNAVDLPLAYFDEHSFQHRFAYQKVIGHHRPMAGKEVTLLFDGAMADARVYLNGEEIAHHTDGYTPFEARLTGRLTDGDNLITVIVDGSENPAIPPFGGQIDYLTYAGIYRDTWLQVTDPISIAAVKIETPEVLAAQKTVRAAVAIANPQGLPASGSLHASLRDGTGTEIATAEVDFAGDRVSLEIAGLTGIALWDIDSPSLYDLVLTLETASGTDETTTTFGFREARFTPEGFRLNGRQLKLRGLNRHQSYPYAGYAMGRAAQERDAEILKHELRLNLVRTSHYPQSTWFLDHCDRIGLLVLEEIPGWQHIGDEAWQQKSVDNVRAMIRRDWNHPSIILWGVRINESQDNHAFYAETNRVARELDPTRQTGGIRFITESEMLEDVYTMNDFVLGNEELGGNRPRTALRPIAETTGLDRPVPYLVTEFNGHMFPTKSYDQEQRQAEHVIRHLEVLNAAYGDPGIAGCVGWCAFDYNTHRDFGSGDRICHHGVMDMFREPKSAAAVYSSQGDPDGGAVLEPVTVWARGERNIGGVLPLIVLTNCDEIEFAYGDNPPRRFAPDRRRFPHLPHPPVILDRADFTAAELGRWGAVWQDASFTGLVGGRAVASHRFVADPVATSLEVRPDRRLAQGPDEVRVAIRALDQAGNRLPYLFEPVRLEVSGPAKLIGPGAVSLRGGSVAAWVRSNGPGGAVSLTVTSGRFGSTRVELRNEEDTAP